MNEPQTIYKPAGSAWVHYMWGAAMTSAGLYFVASAWRLWVPVIAAAGMTLSGAFMTLSTRNVLRTWIVISGAQVVIVQPRFQVGLAWEEIRDIVIRQRPSGIIPGRADRQVVFSGPGDQRFPVNTSVFTHEDERQFLRDVERYKRCEVRVVEDGPFSVHKWKQ
jgi:hypothetical protein